MQATKMRSQWYAVPLRSLQHNTQYETFETKQGRGGKVRAPVLGACNHRSRDVLIHEEEEGQAEAETHRYEDGVHSNSRETRQREDVCVRVVERVH